MNNNTRKRNPIQKKSCERCKHSGFRSFEDDGQISRECYCFLRNKTITDYVADAKGCKRYYSMYKRPKKKRNRIIYWSNIP